MPKRAIIRIVCCAVLFCLVGCSENKKALFDGVSCTGNCFILSGKLIDSASGIGISGGEIRFYHHRANGIFNKRSYLGKTQTDANGNYRFTFNGARFTTPQAGYYTAEAFKDDLFANTFYPNRVAVFDLDSSFYNQPFVQTFTLFQPAYVRVRVVASQITSYQYLNIGYTFGKTGNGIVFNGGRSVDTSFVWKTAGDIATIVTADAVGNGINLQRRDTISVAARTTQNLEIRF